MLSNTRSSLVWLGLIITFLISHVTASHTSRVSVSIPAFGRECVYYDLLDEEDTLVINYQVLYGGQFELDFEITSPKGESIIKQANEKYADFLLKTFGLGQYSFCFSNPYNQLKKVEFSIVLEEDDEDEGQTSGNKDTVVVEHALVEIDRNLNKIDRVLNYLRAREWRNMSTVESTSSRIAWMSSIIICLSVGVSFAQATAVQFMFSSREKNYV